MGSTEEVVAVLVMAAAARQKAKMASSQKPRWARKTAEKIPGPAGAAAVPMQESADAVVQWAPNPPYLPPLQDPEPSTLCAVLASLPTEKNPPVAPGKLTSLLQWNL